MIQGNKLWPRAYSLGFPMEDMTAEQLQKMKDDRVKFMEHMSNKPTRYVRDIFREMYSFEAGWCIALGLKIRETPEWKDQPKPRASL